jgi:hypothetical protein
MGPWEIIPWMRLVDTMPMFALTGFNWATGDNPVETAALQAMRLDAGPSIGPQENNPVETAT